MCKWMTYSQCLSVIQLLSVPVTKMATPEVVWFSKVTDGFRKKNKNKNKKPYHIAIVIGPSHLPVVENKSIPNAGEAMLGKRRKESRVLDSNLSLLLLTLGKLSINFTLLTNIRTYTIYFLRVINNTMDLQHCGQNTVNTWTTWKWGALSSMQLKIKYDFWLPKLTY